MIERRCHDGDWVRIAGHRIAIDQHGPEHALTDELPQSALEPVVGTGDWPRQPPQWSRQHGPNQYEIRVASVIRKIDPAPWIRRAAPPLAAHAGDDPREGCDRRCARRLDHKKSL